MFFLVPSASTYDPMNWITLVVGKEGSIVQRISSAREWASLWSHCPGLTPWALTAALQCPSREPRANCVSHSQCTRFGKSSKSKLINSFSPLLVGFVSIDHLPVVCQSETVFFEQLARFPAELFVTPEGKKPFWFGIWCKSIAFIPMYPRA